MSSTNLFDEVSTDASGVQDRLLGPSYPYYNNIKTPAQMGMSDAGSLSQMGKDIDGLVSYVELLVSGNSAASATGGPLGNKFFLQTGAKCVDSNDDEQDRYIYINNVPVGNIPFISSGMDVNFSEFRGLIPGTMGNLNVLNPFAIMRAFTSGATPDCQPLTMEVIDVNNTRTNETHYVTLTDIQDMDPCIFSDGKNPVTGVECRETFQTLTPSTHNNTLPSSELPQFYFFCLALVGLYFMYKMMMKK
jgi:hypothetical protein